MNKNDRNNNMKPKTTAKKRRGTIDFNCYQNWVSQRLNKLQFYIQYNLWIKQNGLMALVLKEDEEEVVCDQVTGKLIDFVKWWITGWSPQDIICVNYHVVAFCK